ncbi:hypothetical protein LTR10_020187 [Elasticomyces elasticus]|uniref:RNA polymerase II-associated protein 1 C-terminal domain-containing protein n=1 Tax=Exophiala sideris TaxID=1016849 RepID=A0ABR0JCN2_9EURO|nr:hypothetical protein LTR10_020187 [Elasticomyces elasticus]KAK5031355.1 hypothetical protein LTS07_005090 [Exophiala sideris]KAK5039075.1 hypothetical protein LTR13_004106 [Exophiala sideris]KAK5060960.1 hypothetical protein LTR69_005559 [Exophiala sideris]KAK5183871.1 hypothetical protein LTR44_004153 [Eurotiomycetes sp. CCFEE 6388]
MAIAGQRFELDLDAPGFTFNTIDDATSSDLDTPLAVREIREHDAEAIPAAPSLKSSKSGFPEHKTRRNISTFKQRQQARPAPAQSSIPTRVEPSDRAIANHVGKKYGVDLESQQKAEISEENTRRIAEMSVEDIEEARAELMRNLNPSFVERLLKRANIEEDQQQWPEDNPNGGEREHHTGTILDSATLEDTSVPTLPADGELTGPSVHFPVPPRSKDEYVPLDPNDPTFFSELKSHYFPDTPHDPSSMTWLQDPTEEENQDSLYNPEKESYLTSALRFGFNGRLIPPKESLEIDVKEGLHHHGEAPSSAGYTIPELAMLSRSKLPNQRCIAYQILGRVLYRLGRGDFGPRGSELHEALWSVIEKEKPVEVMMAEANRQGGHASAKAHAIEALWLWRKGGGGDRGVLKPGQSMGR